MRMYNRRGCNSLWNVFRLLFRNTADVPDALFRKSDRYGSIYRQVLPLTIYVRPGRPSTGMPQHRSVQADSCKRKQYPGIFRCH